jgi:quercetin dioxygenase-like cupin family protein
MEAMAARVLGPKDGKLGDLGSLGVRFMIGGDESGGGFSLVEHPMPPRGLAAPMHRHTHEDEYSYVLEGRVGAKLGDEVVFGEPGDLIFKPRNQWHTFWNAGDEPARILEIISPAGFERPRLSTRWIVAFRTPQAILQCSVMRSIVMRHPVCGTTTDVCNPRRRSG